MEGQRGNESACLLGRAAKVVGSIGKIEGFRDSVTFQTPSAQLPHSDKPTYHGLAPNCAAIQSDDGNSVSGLGNHCSALQHDLIELAIMMEIILFFELPPLKGTMPEKKLQELKAEREPLFQRFSDNPSQIHLAIEIKLIDDQIAECNHLIQKKTKTRT